MPNWCENILEVQGPESDVNGFIAKLKSVSDESLSLFQALIPMPKEYNNERATFSTDVNEFTENEKLCLEKYGHKDWYSWCNSNWGVKWDASNAHITTESIMKGESYLQIEYSTPWGPGDEALCEALCEFKTLTFHLYYEESGMGFCGAVTVKEGEIVYRQEAELNPIYRDLETSLAYL